MFDKVKEESHKIDQHVKLKGIFIFSSFHGLISPPFPEAWLCYGKGRHLFRQRLTFVFEEFRIFFNLKY